MTTLEICDCGQLAEYDEGLALNCQHCGDRILSPITDGDNEEKQEHDYSKELDDLLFDEEYDYV